MACCLVSECFLLSVDVADGDATSHPSGLGFSGLDCVGCGSVFMWFSCGQCSHILRQGWWFQGVFRLVSYMVPCKVAPCIKSWEQGVFVKQILNRLLQYGGSDLIFYCSLFVCSTKYVKQNYSGTFLK